MKNIIVLYCSVGVLEVQLGQMQTLLSHEEAFSPLTEIKEIDTTVLTRKNDVIGHSFIGMVLSIQIIMLPPVLTHLSSSR